MEMADSLDKLLGNYTSSTNSNNTTTNQNGPRMELTPSNQPSPPLDVPDSSMELIRLNVGGTLFVTTRGTLDRVPDTRPL